MKKPREERRRYKRFPKHFIVRFFNEDTPQVFYPVTQLKNISYGGICLITEEPFEPGTVLTIEMRTPYLAEKTCFSGVVLESHEKIKATLYETRIQFRKLSPSARFILEKMLHIFDKESSGGLS